MNYVEMCDTTVYGSIIKVVYKLWIDVVDFFRSNLAEVSILNGVIKTRNVFIKTGGILIIMINNFFLSK